MFLCFERPCDLLIYLDQVVIDQRDADACVFLSKDNLDELTGPMNAQESV